MVDVVINRASLTPLYSSDGEQAGDDIEALLRGLACLDDIVLRSHDDLWTVPVVAGDGDAPPQTFAEIAFGFYETKERHDVAAFFGELQRMAPTDAGLGDEHLEQLLSCQIDSPAPGLEATFPAVQAAGMDAAQCALTDAVLGSLCRTADLECDQMGFVDLQIARSLIFDHISNPVNGPAVARRRLSDKRRHLTARNFDALRHECFPNLRFGQDVEAHVRRFSAKTLSLAFKRLAELDELSKNVGLKEVSLAGGKEASWHQAGNRANYEELW